MVFGSGIMENIRRKTKKLVTINIDCIPTVNFFKAVRQMPREGAALCELKYLDWVAVLPVPGNLGSWLVFG